MGLENPLHIILLLAIALLVFGAKRLPEVGHSLGHGIRGFKDALSGESGPTEISGTAQQVPVVAAQATAEVPAKHEA